MWASFGKWTDVLALLIIILAYHKHCGQNDLSELFSLLSFVQPSLFKRVHTLQDWFDQPNFEGEQQQQKGQWIEYLRATCNV